MQCRQTDVAEVQSPKKKKRFDSSKVYMSEKKITYVSPMEKVCEM